MEAKWNIAASADTSPQAYVAYQGDGYNLTYEQAQRVAHAANAYPRLVAALRSVSGIPFAPSDNGARWDEGYKAGYYAALEEAFRRAQAALRDVGEEGE